MGGTLGPRWDAPEDNTLAPPPPMVGPTAGLAGEAPTQQEQPQVPGPATNGPANEPEGHENFARHVVDALSGGDPLNWAKAILGGGLAAAANVGRAPAGGGFLYGAARGAEGAQALQRQAVLDKQRLQQQQFENNLKTQQNARAQQELQNATDRTKAEIALMNTHNLAALHEEQHNQLMRPYLEGEAKDRFEALETAKQQARTDFKKVLLEAGVKPEELEKSYDSYENAPSGAAQAMGNSTMLAVHNGEKASADEDGVGMHAVSNPSAIWDATTKGDTKVLSGYEWNPKSSSFTPQYTTVAAGTKYGTIIAMHAAAMDYLQQQENQVTKQSALEQQKANTAEAYSRSHQAEAEAHKAMLEAGLGGLKPADPVLGYDAEGHQVMTNAADAQKLGLHDSMKPDAALVEKVGIARSYIALNNQLQEDIDQLDKDGKLGSIASRWNEFMTGKVGSGDPDFEKFRVDIGLANTALMQFHVGNRGSSQMLEHFEDLANGKKMDGTTLRAGIQAEGDYAMHRAMLTPQLGEQLKGQTLRQPPAKPPEGATMKVPGSDGKMYWSDGKKNLGVVK